MARENEDGPTSDQSDTARIVVSASRCDFNIFVEIFNNTGSYSLIMFKQFQSNNFIYNDKETICFSIQYLI